MFIIQAPINVGKTLLFYVTNISESLKALYIGKMFKVQSVYFTVYVPQRYNESKLS